MLHHSVLGSEAKPNCGKLRIDGHETDPSAKKEESLLSEGEINFDVLIISQRRGWCWNGELWRLLYCHYSLMAGKQTRST